MKKFIAIGLLLLCLLTVFVCITWEKRTPAHSMAGQEATPEPTDAFGGFDEETPAPTPVTEDHISPILTNRFSSLSGNTQWGVYTFEDGREYKNDSESVPSASVIKMFIVEYIMHRIHNVGDISPDDTIGGRTMMSLARDMIAVSDNEATNLVINKFGIDTLNHFFLDKGYTGTRLERKMLDYDAMAAGKENYTSVDDVMKFLKKVYEKQEETLYSDLLSFMKQQSRKWKIPEKLPEGVLVANKTGELDAVENDVGIVFSEHGDYALCFLCSNISSKDAAIDTIAKASRDIYDYLAS